MQGRCPRQALWEGRPGVEEAENLNGRQGVMRHAGQAARLGGKLSREVRLREYELKLLCLS